jgi:hypothetical protein
MISPVAFNTMVRLGGKAYDIRYTDEDVKRREKYFTTDPHEGFLSKEEARLLAQIGLITIASDDPPDKINDEIDDTLSKKDQTRMPDFFNALPNCQTSTAISLSSKCFQPRAIIEQVMNHAALNDQKQHEEAMKKGAPSLDLMARTSALLGDLASHISAPAVPDSLKGLAIPFRITSDQVFNNLFTLIL